MGNNIIFFCFNNSKSDKKHRLWIKLVVIKFLLGCLNFKPKDSNKLNNGFQNTLFVIILILQSESIELFIFFNNFIGSLEYSKLVIRTSFIFNSGILLILFFCKIEILLFFFSLIKSSAKSSIISDKYSLLYLR